MNNSNLTNGNRSTLIETLQAASAELLFISESESPFEVFFWELPSGTEVKPETMINQTGISADTPIEFTDLESFFAVATTHQDWHGLVETEAVNRYQNLVKIIQENLTDIKVVRVGNVDIDVYIVGKTVDGCLAGLKTKVVET
ncbi:nuclease A inhibitor family protein [Merismopedia glauca]|uniref:Nuclease n=1 Tax=Merismopedia glauca CCAP 1448/3 TaxID=1296344 RepID=A0A2T1C1X8_9CYAN|nr:nuclease A inhibitor family protein [Merismopedia glauca]PSB02178.1 nuclease [Merismopedia glauca CCAP 1448/3]